MSHYGATLILTRTDVHDILTDLERDARRQSPNTIRLRRMIADVMPRMDTERTCQVVVILKQESSGSSRRHRSHGARKLDECARPEQR